MTQPAGWTQSAPQPPTPGFPPAPGSVPPTPGWPAQPGPYPFGPPRPPVDLRRLIPAVTIGALGIAATLFGLGAYAHTTRYGTAISFYEAPWATFLILPFLVAGVACLFGLLPRQRPPLVMSASLSLSGAVLMLFYLASFSAMGRPSAGWAYWVVFVIALLQTAAAVTAMLLPPRDPRPFGPPPPQFPPQQVPPVAAPTEPTPAPGHDSSQGPATT